VSAAAGFLRPRHALLAALLGLAGCTGELPQLDALSGPSAEAATGAATPDAPFNPFGEAPAVAAGGREVIHNPSLAEILKPGALPEMVLGSSDAPVVMVQYASLSCPYCRKFHLETFPTLKRELIDTGKLRYVLRAEFPIGKQAGLATIALRCAPAEKYFTLYDKFMSGQASWVSQEVRPEPIFKIAAQVGMTQAQFDSCRQNRGMIAALNAIKERGRTLGVVGTPTFFLDGKLIPSVIGMPAIHAIVDPVLAGRLAQSGAAGRAR
jgi:protein-disulfide isomerase